MRTPRPEPPDESSTIDVAAAAPVVALLDRVPAPPGTPLPLLTAEALASRFDPSTLALLDRVMHMAGEPPPEPADDRIELPVAGLEASAWLAPPVSDAWATCAEAMRADLGRPALVSSGYRSAAFQAMLIVWLAADRGGNLSAAMRRAHPPSRSEHCLPVDHAIDLTTPGAPVNDPAHFAGTPEYAWMRERGDDFGFVESYPAETTDPAGPEPWHWRAPLD